MRKYKVLLVIFFVFLILGIGELIYYWTLINKQKAQKVIQEQVTVQTQTQTPPPGKLPPLEMAKKVLDCLDQNRDERGAYVLSVECGENNQCQNGLASNRDGFYVMWGRTKYIEGTNDIKELETLRKDIDLYLNKEKIVVIQPDFVSKMFLYETWQSKIFSNEEKEKVKALARRVFPPELEMIESTFTSAKSSNYQRPDFVSLIANENTIKKEKSLNESDYTQTVSAASDYIIDYLWFKDNFSLKVAEIIFYNSLQDYFSAKNLTFLQKNLLGLTSTQFYQATGDKMFLNLAVNIYNNSDIQNPCFLSESCPTNLIAPIISAIFSDRLFLETKEAKYQEFKEKMINYLAKHGPDYLRTDSKVKRCYYELFPENHKYKNTMENGLTVGLLSEKGE